MRSEIKYLVPVRALSALRAAISPMLKLDKYGMGYEKVGYTVRSIYLDTHRLMYYHEKIEGLKDRKKIRIRGYNQVTPDTTVFLEIKRKTEAKIAKERTPIPFDQLLATFQSSNPVAHLASSPSSPDAHVSATRFFYHVKQHQLNPINTVVYEREAFEGKTDPTLRITFDRNLRSTIFPSLNQLFEEEALSEVIPDHFILEIKYNINFPYWMTPVLARFGLQKQALSKYVMCLEHNAKLSHIPITSSILPYLSTARTVSVGQPEPTGITPKIDS